MNKLPTLYVVRVVADNLDTLCYSQGGRDIFQTTSLTIAQEYRNMCQAENNMMYNPKYYVCAVECVQ